MKDYVFLPPEGYTGALLKDSFKLKKTYKKPLFAKSFTSFANFLTKLISVVLAPVLFAIYAPISFIASLCFGIASIIFAIQKNAIDKKEATNACIALLIMTPILPIIALCSLPINLIDFIGSVFHSVKKLFQPTVKAEIKPSQPLKNQATQEKKATFQPPFQPNQAINFFSIGPGKPVIATLAEVSAPKMMS